MMHRGILLPDSYILQTQTVGTVLDQNGLMFMHITGADLAYAAKGNGRRKALTAGGSTAIQNTKILIR
jgi:hypothetical protein